MTDSTTPVPSPFDSFNARALEPEQVAKTFVPPPHFERLVKRAHTLIIGPRGSGKTTLLKMLQPAALIAWKHPLSPTYRSRIDFTGVFIPTDINWGEQIKSLDQGQLEPQFAQVLSIAAYTTHVLRSVASAIRWRTRREPHGDHFRKVSWKPSQEAEFVKGAANLWHLSPILPTQNALVESLSARLVRIYQLAKKEILLPSQGRAERFSNVEYLHLPFLEATAAAIELFEHIADLPKGKWGLLFDELELAPKWIRETLIRSLRSVDDRFLFKLSLSPYSEDVVALQSALSAMHGEDFEAVPLWYAHKEDGYGFCRSLFDLMLRERGLPQTDAEDMLGLSEFETTAEEWRKKGNAYGAGSRQQHRFIELFEKDNSFREYLFSRSINPHLLSAVDRDERAADIRKIAALVTVRNAFRSSGESEDGTPSIRMRSRKNPTIYRGAKSLFAMVEGNPRWFIGILDRLLDRLSSPQGKILPFHQMQEVTGAADRFRALLQAIPAGSRQGQSQATGVLTILDAIGRYIHHSVVVEPFNPDPPGSFAIDRETPADWLASLGKALNAGAIVLVPDSSANVVIHSLVGNRFRLSYILAPGYQIPIRLGRSVSLTQMLHDGKSLPLTTLFP
jgi:hypothetical protein